MRVASPATVADLLAATTTAARIAHLRAEGLADETGLGWLLDRAQELVHDEPAMADELAGLCDAAAAGLRLTAVSARACYLRGRVCAERGELDRALDLIEAARRGWSAAGQRLAALRSDLGRMQVLDDLGRHQETAQVGIALLSGLDSVAAQTDQPELCRQLRVMALNNLGASYSQVGDQERALQAYAQAEEGYRALGMLADTAQPLANRGICLLALGRPREALRALREAARIFADTGDRLWAAKCAGIIARAHQQLGELVVALQVLEQARVTLEEIGAGAEAARIELATADVYLAAGLSGEARAAAAAAAEHTGALGLLHDHAVATFTLAVAYLGAGAFDEAASELARAAGLFDQVGDRQHRARVMLARADLAAERGQGTEAMAWADAAADELQAGGWLIPLAWAKLRQADLAPAAATAARLAAVAGLIDQLSLPELRYAYQLRLARVHRQQGRDATAETLLRSAIDAAEQLGAALPDPTLRAAFRSARADAHDELVDMLVARGGRADLAQACLIGDRAKAQTLVELVTATTGTRHRGASANTPDALIEQLSADLSAVYAAMASAQRPGELGPLRRRAEELERQISRLRLRRALGTPQHGRNGAAAGATAALPGEPTLAYHVTGDSVIAFFALDGEVTARRLDGAVPAVRAELDRLVAQWSRFRMGRAFTQRNEAALLATARDSLGALHRLLVAPVADLLAGAGQAALAVIPHRLLHRVPFHALHDGSGYLCEQRAITVLPCMTRGQAAGPPRGQSGGSALVLAVPDALAPSIEAEARSLADALPGTTVLLGPQATSQRLRELMPGPAVLHLACHGLYRPANPLFSALRLADRWVNAAEVLDLDLGGALVTLSACESGRPSKDTAEPVGLAWAFLAAGASGVVVSQWLVDDDAAAQVMSAMYARLATGLAPAEALRQAQLATAARSPHPYRWAPFVYVASPSAEPNGAKP